MHVRWLMLLATLVLSSCASSLTTTWKDPNATALGFKGHKVVAIVLLKDEAKRRLAEDRLAQQIAIRGAEGRSLYSLLPGATADNERETRAALEAAGIKGAIVMRPIYVNREVRITEPYQEPNYASFWGGYYGYGFSMSYSTPREATVSETMVVYVETLVYSLEQNKLVWGGRSSTTNPETLTELINELAGATASELQKQGLITEQ